MSNEHELAQSESQEQSTNSSPESQETPKLLPTILPSLELPSHQVDPSTSSAESAMPIQNASSDTSPAPTESIMVTIGEDVQKAIANIIEDKARYPTATLQRVGDLHLEKLEKTPENDRLLCTPQKIKEKVDAYKIIRAMWDYVKDRTGDRYEHSIRYTAAAIVTCGDVIQKFVALANTWFVLFLWPFRAHSHYNRGKFYDTVTPTRDDTASRNRAKNVREQVLRRDDYTCIVSGAQIQKAHNYNKKRGVARLECTHIFKRSVASFSTSRQDHNAITTLDVVHDYCPQPTWSLELQDEKFDSPCNSIALERNTHIYFDEYKFCFLPVDGKANTYTLKAFQELGGCIPIPVDEEITLKDNSHLHTTKAPDPAPMRATQLQEAGPAPRSVDLPDPWFFSVHATVAHVLYASGAAEFFDSFFGRDFVGYDSRVEMKEVRDIELRFMRMDLEDAFFP